MLNDAKLYTFFCLLALDVSLLCIFIRTDDFIRVKSDGDRLRESILEIWTFPIVKRHNFEGPNCIIIQESFKTSSQLATQDATESYQTMTQHQTLIPPPAIRSLTVSDKLMMKSIKDYDRDPKND